MISIVQTETSKNKTLQNTKGAIKNGQSRETGNIGHTRRRKTKQKHNTICVGHHTVQTNTKTCTGTSKTFTQLMTTSSYTEVKRGKWWTGIPQHQQNDSCFSYMVFKFT